MLLLATISCRLAGPPPLTPQVAARARLLRIEDTRRDEPSLVDSLLAVGDATTASAALAVGRVGASSHAAALRRLATSSDTAIAANAIFSLGLLKDTAAAALAVQALRGGIAKGIEAAWLLGELGERGRSAIVTGLADPALPSSTRAALLLAATRLRPLPIAAVVPLLSSPDSALAWRAAYALARGRGTAGARALLAQSRSPWSPVRDQVARGASRAMAGDSLATIALEALRRLRSDPVAQVRMSAVRSLASFGASVRDPVVASLRDEDDGVRLIAAQSLDLVLDSTAARWTTAFDAETTFAIRRAIAEGAIRRGIDLAPRAGWAASKDWQRRAVAAQLSTRGRAVDVFARLSRRPRDDDGRVRAALAAAFASLGDSVSVRDMVRAQLRAMLADEDVGVRSTALGALTRGVSVDDFAAALASYQRSLPDPDGDARLAFWRLADSAVARHRNLPDSVSHRMMALTRPPDPLERAAAARIGPFSAWRDSAGTARPLRWYEDRAREAELPPPTLEIVTDRGTIDLRLFSRDAPLTVHNMVTLARRGYFDGQRFHRVVPNFVVQAGDPRGDGSGGPGYAIRDEINRRRYLRGTLGMALSGPNTGGSQFFVTHAPQPHLDGGYTVFGEVLSGWDVLDRIVQGDRIVRVTVR